VFAPPFVRGFSALRGVLNPVLDWHLRRGRDAQNVIRQADVEGRTSGRETTKPAGSE
jgi:hypothetical protein